MRTAIATLIAASLLGACAAPDPIVAPAAVGRPAHELAQLVAGSEAKLFPCSIEAVSGPGGNPIELGRRRSEVTLPAGTYDVTLHCTNNAGHSWRPAARLDARAGKRYQVSGYFIDDSVTIFGMKMRTRVTALP